MAALSVLDRRTEGVTPVSNRFIDWFLPEANGEFVKVYLLLLRRISEGGELSVSYMADKLNHTEKDVLRALKYWERMKLLRLEYGTENRLSGLELLPEGAGDTVDAGETEEESYVSVPETVPEEEMPEEKRFKEALPEEGKPEEKQLEEDRPAGTPFEEKRPGEKQSEKRPVDLRELQEDEDFGQLLDLVSCYLGKLLTSRDCDVLANLYAGVGMSTELLEYLVEYCVSNEHRSMRYIETVALNWHERGIETVEQARAETANGGKNTYAVLKAFGLGGRNPAAAERSMIDRWFRDYSFPVDIVLEACDRTMRTIHQPSFEYADKILKEWKEKGVRKVGDIARLDGKPEGRKTGKKGGQAAGSAQNFPQRDYDCDELVKQINGF